VQSDSANSVVTYIYHKNILFHTDSYKNVKTPRVLVAFKINSKSAAAKERPYVMGNETKSIPKAAGHYFMFMLSGKSNQITSNTSLLCAQTLTRELANFVCHT